MPYFSFIINKNIDFQSNKDLNKFELNTKYYSKDTKLWKKLTKFKKKNFSFHLNSEIRKYYKKNYNSILFCLPPNIGLGDAIEYSLAIKSIEQNIKNIKIGLAHIGRFEYVFKNLFKFKEIYDNISETELNSFDSIFHFTLEIEDLALQKYDRKNIEKLITNFFKVPIYRKQNFFKRKFNEKKIISIFPLSNSPIRSLPLSIIDGIINKFINEYKIEIFLDSASPMSNLIFNNLSYLKNITFIDPINVKELILKVKKINFGIFPDSGPLHVAKFFDRRGVLIVSSVDEKILLDQFDSIKSIKSNYKSEYCNGPCGLINAFEINNISGCYDSLKIQKEKILETKNLQSLQRGQLKNNYTNMYIKSFNCYNEFKNIKINNLIKKTLKE